MENDDFINLDEMDEMDEALSAFDGVAAPKKAGLYLALPAVFKG